MEELDRDRWDYVFVRAWYNPCNEGAIRFYKRFGFMPSEIIEQEKIKKDQSGTFIIQKRYFFQKL